MTQTLDTEGKRLKYIREKILALSLEVFGASIAKHHSAIQKWESGLNAIDPSIKLLLEHVYGINPAWLNTGIGEIIFERRSLNGFQMPVYELSNKAYADLFNKDNIVSSKVIMQTDLIHDLANIFLLVATKAAMGIEKDNLLVFSSDYNKGKLPSHYLVEDNGVLDVRLLQCAGKDGIIAFNHSKTSEVQGFQFNAGIVSLDECQIKGKIIKVFEASLWRNTKAILI